MALSSCKDVMSECFLQLGKPAGKAAQLFPSFLTFEHERTAVTLMRVWTNLTCVKRGA